MPLGRQRAKHRHHQAQVLHQHGRIHDAVAHQGPQRQLDDGDEHHQADGGRRQPFVPARPALCDRAGGLTHGQAGHRGRLAR